MPFQQSKRRHFLVVALSERQFRIPISKSSKIYKNVSSPGSARFLFRAPEEAQKRGVPPSSGPEKYKGECWPEEITEGVGWAGPGRDGPGRSGNFNKSNNSNKSIGKQRKCNGFQCILMKISGKWKLLGATRASPNPPTACTSELPVGDTYLDGKIWLSADSKITASVRSAVATRPNGGRETRQVQPGIRPRMQKCAKSTK